MKKALIFPLIFCICLSLTGCDPSEFHYPYGGLDGELESEVSCVRLIRYTDPRLSVINTYFTTQKIRPFHFDYMEIIETLDDEKLDSFLQDFSRVELWNYWYHANAPTGISIMILYINNDFDVISYSEDGLYLFMRYNGIGKKKKWVGSVCNRGDFVDIINQYFETELELWHF